MLNTLKISEIIFAFVLSYMPGFFFYLQGTPGGPGEGGPPGPQGQSVSNTTAGKKIIGWVGGGGGRRLSLRDQF